MLKWGGMNITRRFVLSECILFLSIASMGAVHAAFRVLGIHARVAVISVLAIVFGTSVLISAMEFIDGLARAESYKGSLLLFFGFFGWIFAALFVGELISRMLY